MKVVPGNDETKVSDKRRSPMKNTDNKDETIIGRQFIHLHFRLFHLNKSLIAL